MSGQGSGTYPNLFCAHPPFQIDGTSENSWHCRNAYQSQDGYIELLPRFPTIGNRQFQGFVSVVEEK